MPAKSNSAVLGKLEPILNLVDNRFGPVKNIIGLKRGGKEPPWWVFHAELTRPLGLYFANFECDAWGSSIDKDEALFKCLGETLERYCMYCSYSMDSPEVRPARDCSFLNELPRCAQEEPCHDSYKFIDPSWNLTQVKVNEVATGREHWLPAAFVHFTFQSPHGELPVAISHSSGFAFHETLHQAIWSGLCEVAERDAFSLFWLNQQPVREIAIDSFCESLEYYSISQRVNLLKRAGLKIRCFDITTDFNVPTVFSMVTATQFPYATFGAACSADPVKAISKSIDEVFMVRLAQMSGKDTLNVPSLEKFAWVNCLRDHSDLYAVWKDTPAFDFFLNEKTETVPLSEFANQSWWREPADFSELEKFCSRLQKELGVSVLFSENTLDDVAQYGSGVKVTVPQMMPISVPEYAKWLATPRLGKHADKHGLKKASNPYPHPFP